MRKLIRFGISLILTIILLASITTLHVASAQNRDISFYTEYTSVAVAQEESVSLNTFISNNGDAAEDIDLSISAPENWNTFFTSENITNIQVSSLHLEPQSAPQSLTLNCLPPADVSEGEYIFTLTATSDDRQITRTIDLKIEVVETGAFTSTQGSIVLTTDYPTLEGPAGTTFGFAINLENKSGETRTIDFSAELPIQKNVTFSPAYEPDKNITSLRMDAGATESITMSFPTDKETADGEYSIIFKADSGNISESIEVKAILTGTYKLNLAPPPDNPLYSSNATAGKETKIRLNLINEGSAPLENVWFNATRFPDGWEITFDPEDIDVVDPGYLREIEVTIRPSSNAIAGDYLGSLKANSARGVDTMDLRVKVSTPTAWSGTTIAIVVIVLIILLGIFLKLRRK